MMRPAIQVRGEPDLAIGRLLLNLPAAQVIWAPPIPGSWFRDSKASTAPAGIDADPPGRRQRIGHTRGPHVRVRLRYCGGRQPISVVMARRKAASLRQPTATAIRSTVVSVVRGSLVAPSPCINTDSPPLPYFGNCAVRQRRSDRPLCCRLCASAVPRGRTSVSG
jgi:hypothetical protein